MTANLASVYEAIFSRHELELRDRTDPVYATIARYVTNPEAAILDAGCGSGRYSLSLMRDGFSRVDAFDIAPSAGSRLTRFKVMDLNGSWDYDAAAFDAVVAIASLCYARNLDSVFQQVNRVLKRGGVFVSTFHTRYSLHTLDRVIRRRLASASVPHLQGCRFLPWWTITAALQRQGFTIHEVDGYDLIYVPRFLKTVSRRTGHISAALNARRRAFRAERVIPRPVRATLGYHSIIVAAKQ